MRFTAGSAHLPPTSPLTTKNTTIPRLAGVQGIPEHEKTAQRPHQVLLLQARLIACSGQPARVTSGRSDSSQALDANVKQSARELARWCRTTA